MCLNVCSAGSGALENCEPLAGGTRPLENRPSGSAQPHFQSHLSTSWLAQSQTAAAHLCHHTTRCLSHLPTMVESPSSCSCHVQCLVTVMLATHLSMSLKPCSHSECPTSHGKLQEVTTHNQRTLTVSHLS